MALDLFTDQIEDLAVVTDVCLRMESALRVDADLQTLLFDHADETGNQFLGLVRLVHPFDGIAEIAGRLVGDLARLRPLRIHLLFDLFRRKVEAAEAFGQRLDVSLFVVFPIRRRSSFKPRRPFATLVSPERNR